MNDVGKTGMDHNTLKRYRGEDNSKPWIQIHGYRGQSSISDIFLIPIVKINGNLFNYKGQWILGKKIVLSISVSSTWLTVKTDRARAPFEILQHFFQDYLQVELNTDPNLPLLLHSNKTYN